MNQLNLLENQQRLSLDDLSKLEQRLEEKRKSGIVDSELISSVKILRESISQRSNTISFLKGNRGRYNA
jgi:hypothetical protein